jgi:benzoate-CoA ligase
MSDDRYNATVDLLERNLRGGAGARTYLRTETRTWSYEEVSAAADAAGAGLLERGLGFGDRVILAVRDRPEFVATFWGAIKAGLVPVPIAQGLSAADFEFVMADSEARIVVCDAAAAAAILPTAQAAGIESVFVGDEPAHGALRFSEVCGRPAKLDPAATSGEDIALWLYTSGTTGLPKAVMHRHAHLRAAPAGLASQVIALGADDVVFSVSKMFFAYGLGNSLYLPAAFGSSVVLNEGPSIPRSVHGIAGQFRPTVLFGVPSFFAGLSRLEDATLPDSVRMVLSAGEALSGELADRFRERFGRSLLDGLGSTEAMHHFSCNRPDDIVPGSAGRPLDGYEVQVLDREGEPTPAGESGELWIKGPTTFAGYWRRPELTARAYKGEWMRTGDLVRLVDGRIFHEGRLDDLIKLGGIWVAPVQIEDVLKDHPDVVDAAVVSVDQDTGIPVLKAFVLSERDDAPFFRELQRLCKSRLASFKVPRTIEVVAELPRTPTGKLRRFVLRQSGS